MMAGLCGSPSSLFGHFGLVKDFEILLDAADVHGVLCLQRSAGAHGHEEDRCEEVRRKDGGCKEENGDQEHRKQVRGEEGAGEKDRSQEDCSQEDLVQKARSKDNGWEEDGWHVRCEEEFGEQEQVE